MCVGAYVAARAAQVLLNEKRKMEATQERKRDREYKKYAKQVQAEKIKERQKEKVRNSGILAKRERGSTLVDQILTAFSCCIDVSPC